MNAPFRIWLKRHGESEGNVDPSIYGMKPDHMIELTPKGWEQTLTSGQKLSTLFDQISQQRDEEISLAIYHSSYLRSRQSAQGTYQGGLSAYSPRVKEDDRLIEQVFGLGDGLTDEARGQRYPDYEEKSKLHLSYDSRQFVTRAPESETRTDVAQRGKLFIDRLFREHEQHNTTDILVETHGVTLRMVWKELMQYPYEAVDQERISATQIHGSFAAMLMVVALRIMAMSCRRANCICLRLSLPLFHRRGNLLRRDSMFHRS